MRAGKVLYRDIWFDKPPLAAGVLSAVRARGRDGACGSRTRCIALLCCWIAFRFARDLWRSGRDCGRRGCSGFFLIFDFPSAVIPVASDFLMLAPHLAAVWMAYRGRPFWSGVLAGVAFWIESEGRCWCGGVRAVVSRRRGVDARRGSRR